MVGVPARFLIEIIIFSMSRYRGAECPYMYDPNPCYAASAIGIFNTCSATVIFNKAKQRYRLRRSQPETRPRRETYLIKTPHNLPQ
jgi:hypothetical protein